MGAPFLSFAVLARDRAGILNLIDFHRIQNPHPPAKNAGRMGHPVSLLIITQLSAPSSLRALAAQPRYYSQ
jgi:hypothetical protein